jgi:hypothetical protein
VKLRHYLDRRHPEQRWPAPSSIGALLQRHGLCHRRGRTRVPHATPSLGLTPPDAPNVVWCIDFKGQFPTGDGQLCYP